MKKTKEYDDLRVEKERLLRQQEIYRTEKNEAKKLLGEMDYGRGQWRMEELAQNIYQSGEMYDKRLLDCITETSELMKKQEWESIDLLDEIELDYKKKERKSEEEIDKIDERLRVLESL